MVKQIVSEGNTNVINISVEMKKARRVPEQASKRQPRNKAPLPKDYVKTTWSSWSVQAKNRTFDDSLLHVMLVHVMGMASHEKPHNAKSS